MPDTIVTRRCTICKQVKQLDEFSESKSRPLGKQYNCKECSRNLANKWYRNNTDKVSDRKKTYRRNGITKKQEQRYYKNNQDKIKARRAIGHAIEFGKIIPPSNCANCGSADEIQAHHHRGYAPQFWLDVQWICRSCHSAIHRL